MKSSNFAYENKYFIYDDPQKKGIKYIIKRVLYTFYNIWIKLLILIANKKPLNKKYQISICAIFKNEAKYLKEWLDFHSLIGVDHFYMYNNNSTDGYKSILADYIKAGKLTLINWEKNQAQMEAYKDCINKFSEESSWIGFIDIDEFIIPKQNYSELKQLFNKYYKQPSLLIYWKSFGTSGQYESSENLVTERFTVAWPKFMNLGKCFYNTNFKFNYKKSSVLHHYLVTKIGCFSIPPINAQRNISKFGINRYIPEHSNIQLNHYFTKSFKEYEEKKSKGDVYFKINPHDEQYFYEHELRADVVDYSAYRYLIKLKRIMKEEE